MNEIYRNRHAEFAFDLLRGCVALCADQETVCVSPYSATVALAMAYNGARNQTKEQIAKALHISDVSTEEFNRQIVATELSISETGDDDTQYLSANSLWVDKDFQIYSTYEELCRNIFNAEAVSLFFKDPATLEAINKWVAEKTQDKISELLKALDPLDVVVLINALYFKGNWACQFDEPYTKEKDFFCGDGSIKQVPTMVWSDPQSIPYYRNELFESVLLSYSDSSLSMLLLKPSAEHTLFELLSQLQADKWSSWITQYQKTDCHVSMPRFELDANIDLVPVLQNLGVIDAFECEADFFAISNKPLHISQVVQKTYLKVDEKGSEAAAATAVVLASESVSPPALNFVLDRPFLSLLYDQNSGAILLMAAVNSL